MNEFEERRLALLHNLAVHARLAREQLRLSPAHAARLAGLTPEVLAAVERGEGNSLSLAAVEHIALFLGLTECGLPRHRPAGMH